MSNASTMVLRKPLSPVTICEHAAPYDFACLTPDHESGGSGTRQRISPTGGLANGTPRNVAMSLLPSVRAQKPSRTPQSVVTLGACVFVCSLIVPSYSFVSSAFR